jgi:hypothetical protein
VTDHACIDVRASEQVNFTILTLTLAPSPPLHILFSLGGMFDSTRKLLAFCSPVRVPRAFSSPHLAPSSAIHLRIRGRVNPHAWPDSIGLQAHEPLALLPSPLPRCCILCSQPPACLAVWRFRKHAPPSRTRCDPRSASPCASRLFLDCATKVAPL